jgi:hypothetical protein
LVATFLLELEGGAEATVVGCAAVGGEGIRGGCCCNARGVVHDVTDPCMEGKAVVTKDVIPGTREDWLLGVTA